MVVHMNHPKLMCEQMVVHKKWAPTNHVLVVKTVSNRQFLSTPFMDLFVPATVPCWSSTVRDFLMYCLEGLVVLLYCYTICIMFI